MAVLPMMATAATKRSLLNMVLWRWWPMGCMLVVCLRRRMDSVRYQLQRAERG